VTLDWRILLSAAIGISIAAGLVLAVEELFWMRRQGRLSRAAVREMLLSLSTLPPNVIASILLTSLWVMVYSAAREFAPWHMPMNVATLLLALLVADFCYYWEHRCAHRVEMLWAAYHAVHHSSSGYTVATAYRVSFANQLIAPAFYLPCSLLGFEPLLVVGLQVLSIHYQAWMHTDMIGPLGVLDRLLNTPANHRVHHDAESSRRGRNFGGMFIVWDRMFGTYEAARPVTQFGIGGQGPPGTVLSVYTQPLRLRRARGPGR
jgi:sterol desaturase/sphingolipid hydroxylase (fatty acid hydroxylase superfamily)